MRALILALSAVIVALAVMIVVEISGRAGPASVAGKPFAAGLLIADAEPGEIATYGEEGGRNRRLSWRVAFRPPVGPDNVPTVEIQQQVRDPRLPPASARRSTYRHRLTDHFWFPLMEPSAPDALDRVWVLRSIKEAKLQLGDKERDCWKITLIDPALPADSETVVAWVDPSVPVFGLLKWQRRGETWTLLSSDRGGSS